ncbi:uncharacterized protein isoform X2 [Musca autumnalis]|uniref:uncharacterized protein isoform X2 n=1 Tax=Musca autumnalis TaxID=221902 RepID=UPI003CE7E074
MGFSGLKITYILPNGRTSNKCNRLGINNFSFREFKSYLVYRLPDELKDCELRYYWIDNNGDEIDIVDSCDYFAFNKLTCFHHVFVGPKKSLITEFPAPTPDTSHSNHRYPAFAKITYKLNGTKFTRYFDNCYKDIAKYLLNDLKQDTHKLRYYWIDDNGDEVDIEDIDDYITAKETLYKHHIYIAPINQSTIEEDNPATMANNTTDSSKTVNPTAVVGHLPKTNVSHDANNVSSVVKCDSCVMEPIVGFRYKCTQCVNYDHLMILKPNVDGEKCKESDRNEECSHVHQSFFTQLYEMMNNFLKDFGKVETAAGTIKTSTESINQDSKEVVEEKVICKTPPAKQSGSTTPIHCEQMEMVTAATGDSKSNKRTDSVISNIKVPGKSIDDDFILKTLNEGVITQRIPEKSSENANKVIYETLWATSKEADATTALIDNEQKQKSSCNVSNISTSNSNPVQAKNQSLKDFIQSHDPELVRNGFEIWKNFNNMFAKMFELMGEVEGDVEAKQPFAVNLHEEGNSAQQINDISKSMKILNTITHPSKSVENNGEQKKRQEDNENVFNNSISEPLLKLNTSSQDNKATPAVRPTTPTTLNNLNFAASKTSKKESTTISVYHPDERINNSVHAMMLMGFNNEDGWLTKLLESVNGNIPDAITKISANQRNNR